MLFKVSFLNKKNENQKFIVCGVSEENCSKLAISYIKDKGGAIGIVKLKKITSIE